MKANLLLIGLLLVVSCSLNKKQMSDIDKKIISDLNFDENLISLIRETTGSAIAISSMNTEVEYAFKDSLQYEHFSSKGIKALVFYEDQQKAVEIVKRLREQFAQKGYCIYVSETNFGNSKDEVTILKTNDKYDVLRFEGTNGINYDIFVEDLISKLMVWDQKYNLKIVASGMDFFEAEYTTPPADIMQFAQEVYEFCPDVVDQGTETVEALANEMARSNTLYLWWD